MKSASGNMMEVYRPPRWPITRGGVLLSIAVLFVAIILGALSSLLPPIILLAAVAAIVLTGFAVSKPNIGLLAALVLVFEIIPEDMQPGVGKLRAYDVMVIFLAAVVLIRTIARGDAILRHLGSMVWPLAYLIACLATSLLYVRYYAPNDFAISEVRAQFMWLLVPLIAIGVDTRARFKFFVVGIMVIGVAIAVYVTIESMFHIQIMAPNRVGPLDVRGNSDIVRSTAGGGIYILTFSLLLCINLMLERRLKVWAGAPLAMILCFGLAMQYGRGVWVATLLGLLLSAQLYRGWSGVMRVLAIASIAIAVLLGGMAVVKPRVTEALVERAVGIGDELESGGSFGFRKQENRLALVAIEKHPLFGVGIGGIYKQTVSSLSFANESTYIHNSWLWFPLKLGLWASLVPFVFILCFYREILRGIRVQAKKFNGGRWFAGAVAGAFLVPVVTSYTQPEWAAAQGISAFAVMIGCALLYLRWGSPFQDPAPPKPVAQN